VDRRILIADDDPHIRDVLSFALGKAGMKTLCASNGAEALEMAKAGQPDLIILDINMPRMDGLEVCRRLRAEDQTPILFLSSRDEEIDRIVGLEVGGDDYVVKPFSPREVVARINVILKRLQPAAAKESAPSRMSHGALSLDTDTYEAAWNGDQVDLTAKEFHLLQALMRRPGNVLSRDQLIDATYGPGFALSDRTVDSHLRHIRQKFAEAGASDIIETVRGIGYRLAKCAG
jgi:two-component system OmpR family response regulator